MLSQRGMRVLYSLCLQMQRSLAMYKQAAAASPKLRGAEQLNWVKDLTSRLQCSDPWALAAPAVRLGTGSTGWEADASWMAAEHLHADLVAACGRTTGKKLAGIWIELKDLAAKASLLRCGLALLGARAVLAAADGTGEEEMVAVLSHEFGR